MDIQYYEAMLQKHFVVNPNAEALWDARAKSFGQAHKKSGMDSSYKVAEILLGKGLLKDFDVLDIGGGTGRYAVPFAEHANEVIVADISAGMMERARENAENAGFDNLQYKKLNWDNADLKTLGWERRFDLVFASMCPAVKSKAGIDKMSAASKGWCQINQLIEMTDNISQKLARDLEIEKKYDPHNDRDAVQGTFNLLWIQGFEPEVTYLKEAGQQVLSIEEALPRYTLRYGKAAEMKGMNVKRLLEGYADGDSIAVDSRTTVALILWKV